MKNLIILCFTAFLALHHAAYANNDADIILPEELQPFIEDGTRAFTFVKADLNEDNLSDYILVLEKLGEEHSDSDTQRPTLIITRDENEQLSISSRNDRVIYCSNCGGLIGDPFESIESEGNSIIIRHSGGSAWRWQITYRFDYTPQNSSWLLFSVTNLSYHAGDPESAETTTSFAGDDFMAIGFDQFNPELY